MKYILFILFSLNVSDSDAQVVRDIITDPMLSKRCKSLLKDRKDKMLVRQRLHTLLLRNQELQGQLKESQKTTANRLELNKIQIQNNLRLAEMKVKAMEERIVRRGCPGATL